MTKKKMKETLARYFEGKSFKSFQYFMLCLYHQPPTCSLSIYKPWGGKNNDKLKLVLHEYT